jgi:hypothetical protein
VLSRIRDSTLTILLASHFRGVPYA